jgi:hypothetical protein
VVAKPIAYRSQPHDRASRRPFKLQAKLSGHRGISKPKWMRWRIYDRKLEEIATAEEVVDAHMLAFVQKLHRRLGR